MNDNRTGYDNFVLQTIFQGQLISLPIKNPKMQTVGVASFLHFSYLSLALFIKAFGHGLLT